MPQSDLNQATSTLIDLAIRFGPKLLVAILVLAAGYYVGRWVGAFVERWLGKLHLEPPVQLLLVRVARLVVLALFLIVALQNLGVDLLPLIAGLSVAGAAVALAMQGVLGNLAAGLTIIFTKPFRVGEYVAMVGVEGRVDSIDLFTTQLSHPDRSVVVVPNRKIVGEILHNYGEIRQLDLKVEIATGAHLERALAAIDEAVAANARVLREPAPVIGVAQLGAGTIGIAIKPWVKVADYVAAGGELNLAIVEKLRAAGVDYPMSARNVRLVNP
ncbi:MAG TPA: mechanosensitive ion channel family protein [Burkholderiales bacterium]|nr:mechanosensitive ion channel family protein [Burkholderiales bacterium]